jgi:hypothetical protein
MLRAAAATFAVLALAGPASAAGPTLVIGAAEDSVRQPTIVTARTQLDLLSLAGLRAVRVTSHWSPGLTEPLPAEQAALGVVSAAASLTGMRVFVAVFNTDSTTTPLSDTDQAQFASYAAAIARKNAMIRDFVIGNEPNLNRFWMPQFGPGGSDAAATAYESLLARTYDSLKAVSPQTNVIGGAVSPRGSDKPDGIRPTHSPTAFIADLGTAYRQSGRALPIMDSLAIHPYQDNSSVPPGFAHPNNTTIAIADYGKLVTLLGNAFDGTAQRGSTLPIVYGEFGVETIVPTVKASLYTGTEPASVKPVDAVTQGRFYREALALAFCQPTVSTFLFFHAIDEPDLDRWQSGMFYADDTPKASLIDVEDGTRDARGGVITKCSGLQLTPKATVAYPKGGSLKRIPLSVRLTCDIDCTYRVRLERYPLGSTTLSARGSALARVRTTVKLPLRRVRPGRYRFTVTLAAPVNTGPPSRLASRPVTLR